MIKSFKSISHAYSFRHRILADVQNSEASDYYSKVLGMLGKVSVNRLKYLIMKYQASNLPSTNADVEAYIAAALDATWIWACANGEWNGLLEMLKQEIGVEAEEGRKNMEDAYLAAKKLSESRIKILIRTYATINDVPQLDHKLYVGKLLKDDYIASLIDVLRESNENDYSKVKDILTKESKRGEEKGFGKVSFAQSD